MVQDGCRYKRFREERNLKHMKEGMQRIVGDPCLLDMSCYKLVGRSGGGGSILYMREMVIGLLELSL